ncbi:TRAP transporter permease [Sulfitobacter geojensis]|uniref:TRAP transporter permease n=2 Tax=Sulfitobacter geojensis TaxID=1342299 RepID=A0AAE2W0Q2_9RHOB|nr:TRAP transporter permease [Sulfitobacter geojensis]MBM1690771.1 TRAP transporter permease [Sulfitobacter geojensis]MBM1694837.1 TRAP transporter permease [Sulfitobacter geojensis]MBM1707009.1 TRAP transporter permease [Sulfitobacter geojensis]MBM1711067.1 TRAP transporter permease [Sulfitobacter geojensis]MBM1715133.1 TRAP transporter permease [Sulfitobacter geojensis]
MKLSVLTDKMPLIVRISRLVLIGMAFWHLYVAFFGPPNPYIMRGVHVALALLLIYLTVDAKGLRNTNPRWYDIALALIAGGAALYPSFNLNYITQRFLYVDPVLPMDIVVGITLVVLLLEATRRMLGPMLPITAILFMAYGLAFTNTLPTVLLEQLFMTPEGIFGIPIAVSATYMVLFILFGSLVEKMGVGQLFMDFAVAITGRQAGGPAKVACVTSGLFGSVSGSAVANVMTTGTFSIPLMKRMGFKPAFAGAVEAVASTGGQIMPPVMGAAAFVMAEYLGTGYLTVAKYALAPAILFYIALFAAVHFEAKRKGIGSVPKEDQVPLKEVIFERGHLFAPLIIIVTVLMMGYSAPYAALWGIMSVVPVAAMRKTTRHFVTVDNILDALEGGARNVLAIASACACAGIVVGVIDITGLGLSFSNFVIEAAQDKLVIALLLSMVAGIILGMGMPTTPAYIVQVALLVPALVKLGVQVEAAHLFVFYFAILSAITPPVAIAVYAANTLSHAKIVEASWAAVKLGATGFIVPFMFVYEPAILMQGNAIHIALVLLQATIGVIILAASLQRYFFGKLENWLSFALFIAALLLIYPDWRMTSAGLAIAGGILALQKVRYRNATPQTAANN